MSKRQLLYRILNFVMIVFSPMMIWKGLKVVTGSESPIVVMLNEFHRGDLLFLTNYKEDPIHVGDIVMFKVHGRDIPIASRVFRLREKKDGSVKILTKGDNNSVDDRGLYAPGQLWLQKKDIVGRVRGFVPFLGIVLLNDYPKFKYFLLVLILVRRKYLILLTSILQFISIALLTLLCSLIVIEFLSPFFAKLRII